MDFVRELQAAREAESELAMDSTWIKNRLKELPEKSQTGLARALGLHPSAVTRMLNDTRQIKASEIPKITAYFGTQDSPTLHQASEPARAYRSGDSIPVFGTAEGGGDGVVEWNGEVIELVPRPPFLADVKDAYALYVVGESMVPRYNPGELIYVHPKRPVSPGGYGVFQIRVEGHTAPRALIKQLVRRTSHTIVLAQFNPKKELEIKASSLIAMHRIVGSGET
ncbi:MAG: helix-turn-helix transcriptional regulator [Proteobacteria bacterium]|nr:helix-turn-helix transcriptional regulator [Pseudomonadota bacterium]